MKVILYILIIWFLVRLVSRFFLPSAKKKRRQKSVLYQIFSQLQNQANNGSGSSSQSSSGPTNPHSNSGPNKRKNLDDIEEAEFEDITEDERN